MTAYIVDTSVAALWYLPEEHADQAAALIHGPNELTAPDFLLLELANALLKRVRRKELPLERVRLALRSVRELVELVDSQPLFIDAFEHAARYTLSTYDALYVALAIRQEHPLVTADRRLFNALQPRVPQSVAWIETVRID